ncbi:MAG: type II toxin-antitoxin system HicB family antitoxin [Patescibacteria group bacterium]
MKIQDYTVIFHPEPEGGFTVVVPSLPGCVTYGKTLKSAKAMITDAIEGYIASLIKHGEPVPSDEATFISTVHVHNPAVSVAYA